MLEIDIPNNVIRAAADEIVIINAAVPIQAGDIIGRDAIKMGKGAANDSVTIRLPAQRKNRIVRPREKIAEGRIQQAIGGETRDVGVLAIHGEAAAGQDI